MKRVWSMLVAAVVLATAFSATAQAAPTAPKARSERVTIVIATGLTWADITATSTPTLWRIAQQGALGNVNARMRNRNGTAAPSALEGALDLSAGNWATPAFGALQPDNTNGSAAGTSTAELFARIMGHSAGASAICYPGLPANVAENADPQAGVVLGLLGEAVHKAGGFTGAIGNSDSGDPADQFANQRPAAIAVTDMRGLVDAGDVSADLLAPDPVAPEGRATDIAAFDRALAAFDASATAHGGPVLLALDPGDAYRARRDSTRVEPAVAERQRAAANRELDQIVQLAQNHGVGDDTIIVVSESPEYDRVAGVQGFGPLLVWAPGAQGYVSSGSTHRTGLVTNLDVTAEALSALGVEQPVEAIGSRFTTATAPAGVEERLARLSGANTTAMSIDGARGAVADYYVRFFVALMAFGGVLIAFRARFSARVRSVLACGTIVAALFALSIVPAGWLMFVFVGALATPAIAVVWLLVFAVVLTTLGAALWRFAGARAASAALALFAAALLTVDQFFGAPLSFINFMGYSPLQSARYYGMGNQTAGYVVGAALVGLALVVDHWHAASWAEALKRYGLAIAGAVVVVAAAAPFLGANVGVAVWGTAGFGVAWALTNRFPITLRVALVGLIVIVLLIGAFAAADLLNSGPKTHLARSLDSAQQGGVGQLWEIVARKAETNARVLGETQWTWPLIAVLGLISALYLRREAELPALFAEIPALRAAVIATLVAGVLAFLTEDSGIVVPAFLFLPMGATLVIVLLDDVLEGRLAE